MVRQNFLEFVLLKEQVDSKFASVEKRVNYLFGVQLTREEEDSERCWVKVEGGEDDIRRAKDYIIEVCSRTLSSLEEAEIVWKENNFTSTPVDRTATKQNTSVVEVNNNDCHKDEKDLVQKTTDQSLDSNERNRSEDADNSLSLEKVSEEECAETAEQTSPSDNIEFASRSAFEMGVNRNEAKKPSVVVEKGKGDEKGCDSSVSDESLRDFAKKLGYNEDTITTGLSKLGPLADTNSLLSELVKAQSSVKQLEEGSSTFNYEKPAPVPEDSSCLRPIVIDGSNVAMSHGNQKVFSCRGIGLVVDWFLARNHLNIKVFVPMWRKNAPRPDSPITNQDVLKRLEEDCILVWTPSRTAANGKIIKCYDDRYIIKHAADIDGVIVSNDNFRDLMAESHDWRKVIEQRLLMYSFVDDKFMPPDDPIGRHGPTLDEFLKKGCGKLCPYLSKCTYGKRCRFLHPDRNQGREVNCVPANTAHLPPEVPYGHVSRPPKPLPPCPPRPLPATPTEFLQKPLPLPPHSEFPAEMARVFPPTLRTGQVVGIGERRSDPLPCQKQLPPDVQAMQVRFQRTHSIGSVQDQACGGAPVGPVGPMLRRGSLPHAYHPPQYSSHSGHPDIMVRGSMTLPRMPREKVDWMIQEQMFGGSPYQYRPQYHSNPPVSSPSHYKGHPPASLLPNHWNLPPFPPAHHQYPPVQQYHHYRPAPPYDHSRTPCGQNNNYMFRSRAPPIIGGISRDVTDNPEEGDNPSSHEDLRINAYDKLCEIFPDEVEKVLKILDKYPDETSIESLTQHMLDDIDE